MRGAVRWWTRGKTGRQLGGDITVEVVGVDGGCWDGVCDGDKVGRQGQETMTHGDEIWQRGVIGDENDEMRVCRGRQLEEDEKWGMRRKEREREALPARLAPFRRWRGGGITKTVLHSRWCYEGKCDTRYKSQDNFNS